MVPTKCFYTVFRCSPQKRKVGVVPYVFACHENVQYSHVIKVKKKKRFFYFAVDSFSIYVIRSQHKQYWGYGSSGTCRRVIRSVFPKMSGPTHPLTQLHLLDPSALPLSEPEILQWCCLHEYSGKYETGVNFSFCTAVRNDHADHKMCVSNTVPSALHIVIMKPSSSWPGYKWEKNTSGLIQCFLIHIISALTLQLFICRVHLGI